jgi:hypothetical protein
MVPFKRATSIDNATTLRGDAKSREFLTILLRKVAAARAILGNVFATSEAAPGSTGADRVLSPRTK